MDSDNDDYLDFLSEAWHAMLQGNQPGFDPYPSDQHQHPYGIVPLTMATIPPAFNHSCPYINRCPNREPNPVLLTKSKWSTIQAKLPVIAPTTASTKIKNGIFTMLMTGCLEATEGNWKDKTEPFTSIFHDHALVASSK
jgi:hypothetical protein